MSTQYLTLRPEDFAGTDLSSGNETWFEPLVEFVRRAFSQGDTITVEQTTKTMTPAEFAAAMGCSRSKVSRLIKAGTIHADMVGTHHRIPVAEFKRYSLECSRKMMTTIADELDAELFGDE